MILVWSRKAIAESSCTLRSCRGWKSQWTTDFSRKSGTYIVYNSHVTCSNSSFLLTMVTPTSHFFSFHWLCCLFPIGYLPKPSSVGVRICHYHWNSTTSTVQVIFRYLRPDAPVFNIHRIHSTSVYGDISAITLLILSLSGCSCVNILWIHSTCGHDDILVITPVLSVCKHLPYSHPQVMLIYYTRIDVPLNQTCLEHNILYAVLIGIYIFLP